MHAGPCLEPTERATQLEDDKCRAPQTNTHGRTRNEDNNFKPNQENDIMSAIIQGHWDEVIRAAKRSPTEISKRRAIDLGGKGSVRIFPIHYACTVGAPHRVIRALAKAAPEALTHVDHHDHTLLHWVVDKKTTSPATVQTILKYAPESALLKCSKDGSLPIHMACRRNDMPAENQIQIVKLLLGAFPDGVFFKDDNNELPLHVAVNTAAPAPIIKVLVEAGPAAATAIDMNIRLPIDVALEKAARWSTEDRQEIIAALADAQETIRTAFVEPCIFDDEDRRDDEEGKACETELDNKRREGSWRFSMVGRDYECLETLVEEDSKCSSSNGSGRSPQAVLPPVSFYPTIAPFDAKFESIYHDEEDNARTLGYC